MSQSDPQDGDGKSFADILDEYDKSASAADHRLPSIGDKVRGRVVSIGREVVLVDLGTKAEGTIDLAQVKDDQGQLTVALNQEIEAHVAEINAGTVVLRTSLGRGKNAAAELEQAYHSKLPVEGVVTAVNKGGLDVLVAGIRAFCPMSQIDNRFVEDASRFIGERLHFRITRYEEGRTAPNLVLSRRVIMEEEAALRAEETRRLLRVGAVLRGKVTSLKDYGAFVDLGGIEGMVHISEIGFSRVEHPSDVLSLEQEVDVQVLKIEKTSDPRRPEKIALSLKALASDPWSIIEEKFPEGTITIGKIVRTQQFGAFVELMPGIEGLVHISQLGAIRRINHPSEVVEVGQDVEVTVVRVERDRRRIALSMVTNLQDEGDVAPEDREFMEPPPDLGGFGTFADLLNDGGRGRKGRGKKGRRHR